ncbi:transferase [Rhodobacterales bacterium LSUCC0031]|nr:transferase [Rhodobacterales bacterium LSUCC0031]
MKNKRQLLIFGSGTLGEVANYYFTNDSDYEVVGFVEMQEFMTPGAAVSGKPVYGWESVAETFSPSDVDLFVAIGYRKTNSIRRLRYEQVLAAGYTCASYISSKATNFSESIGSNCFILENNVLQPFTRIGNNVTLWSGNHIGHHSAIEDHCFVASHAVISGNCRIGESCFIGVNCCMHDGVTIGPKSVLGAGSIVADSCEPRSVFAPQATPPRIIQRDII